jgi:DNA topoisomerase-1
VAEAQSARDPAPAKVEPAAAKGDPAPAKVDARAMGLRYVDPESPGITRARAGKGFSYRDPDGRPIRNEDDLERIRAIAIPPAWTEVWICPSENGHIQAIGRDARGRRQYRYHARFRARRDKGKFERLIRFGKALPRIRRRVAADLRRPGLPQEKVVAAVVALLESTRFRVGNAQYARLNRSFGVSTLRRRHATVSGSTIRFRFRGKGGRDEERQLVDRRLAALVRRCQDLPGQSLFQYVGEDGEPHGISSDDVNDYLREAAGSDEFSAKDFRTWMATVLAHQALRAAAEEPGPAPKAAIAEALEVTAEQLGDTVTVTRNSYVHPAVLEAPVEPTSDRRGARAQASARVRAGAAARPVTRRDELDVLATLRDARPSQSSARSSKARSTRPAA